MVTTRFRARRGAAAPALTCWALAALAAHTALAQPPADSLFNGFEQSGDFLFELGGKDLAHAEVYLSDRAMAYLIIAPELSSPVMILPRKGTVESVHLMGVARRANGTVDLLADAEMNELGKFRIDKQQVIFEVKGQPAKLKPKPPLLGLQPAEALKAYKPDYARGAADYKTRAQPLAALKAQQRDVRVRFYFGTWCPACSRLMPGILRVAGELEGSKVRFEYYGLPKPMGDDPIAEREKIHSIPTGVVYVGGKEVGRLEAGQLSSPEVALRTLLAKS